MHFLFEKCTLTASYFSLNIKYLNKKFIRLIKMVVTEMKMFAKEMRILYFCSRKQISRT